jgi:DNA-binding MarR family transcriptional regulator
MEEHLKLENQLCFSIYSVSRFINRIYSPYLNKFDLTYLQYIVMLVLWENKKIELKELGEILFLDSGTLSPLIKKLEKKELILKKRNENDERIVEIFLTEKGANLKEEIKDIPLKIFEKSNLSLEEYTEIKKSMDNFIQKYLKNNYS